MTETTNTHLAYLLEWVNAQPDWRTLDISRSGGQLVLAAAGGNVHHDAVDKLPFDDNTFDLVSCRVAAKHVADVYRLVVEARRVLKLNGILAVHDVIVPDHKRAAEYLNAFERLRDLSYVNAYSQTYWRSTFLDADLTVERVEIKQQSVKLHEWAQGCSAYVMERLHILLHQAPRPVADWLQPTCIGTTDTTFEQHFIFIMGKKSS
jgi:SAM-dependent methyltransferase